jgi:hypothetical protein
VGGGDYYWESPAAPTPSVRREAKIAAAFVWVPIVATVAAVVFMMMAWVLGAVADEIDRPFTTHPLEPGRWETTDGKYSLDLEPDGTGSVHLRSAELDCDVVYDGPVSWDWPGGKGFLVVEAQPSRDCGRGYLLFQPSGGYDWNRLAYSSIDLDSTDAVFRRVTD